MRYSIFGPLLLAGAVRAHLAVYNKGMYCLNGTVPGVDNQNNDSPVSPLWNLPKSEWWFHHVNGCDEFPPANGDFLEIPAGGSFTVEIASNRASTSLSFNSKYVSAWLDGTTNPNGYNIIPNTCISSPNMHTQNESMAAGTAFAISYTSELSQVTPENLAVFTVTYNTPWKRLTTYEVPAAMPPCPAGGCICAWGWVPNGCGEPNIYMQGFKCNVTGSTSTTPIATAQPPVWCENKSSSCVSGAKQLIYWNQAEGNNIEVSGYDLSGSPKSPAYNNKLGFANGAQNDIFQSSSGAKTPSANYVDPKSASSSSKPSTTATPSSCNAKKRSKRSHRRRSHY